METPAPREVQPRQPALKTKLIEIAQEGRNPDNRDNLIAGFKKPIRDRLDPTSSTYNPNYDLWQAQLDNILGEENPALQGGGRQELADTIVRTLRAAGFDLTDRTLPLESLTRACLDSFLPQAPRPRVRLAETPPPPPPLPITAEAQQELDQIRLAQLERWKRFEIGLSPREVEELERLRARAPVEPQVEPITEPREPAITEPREPALRKAEEGMFVKQLGRLREGTAQPQPPGESDENLIRESEELREQIEADILLNYAWRDFDPTTRPDGRLEEEMRLGPYQISAGSDRGEVRKSRPDEDSYQITRLDDLGETLLVLADGAGGMGRGDEASRRVTAQVTSSYQRLRREGRSQREALREAFEYAHKTIVAFNRTENAEAMSTGVAAVLNDSGGFVIANVGDSRAYWIFQDGAMQMTIDHNFASEEARLGHIRPEEIYTHPQRNLITRSLGGRDDTPLKVDICQGLLGSGEQLMLCCDGLWEMTRDPDGSVIHRFARSAQSQKEVVRRLLAKANQEGGDDNITVVVAKFNLEQKIPPPPQPREPGARR